MAVTSIANAGSAKELTGCLANVGGIECAIPYALANVDGIEVVIPFGEQVSGTPLAEYAEGDIVYLNENGSPVEFYVAKHDYESGLNGAGRTLLVRRLGFAGRKWHSSDVNAYATSDLDKWFNNDYKAMLDADIQSAIGTTKFYYTPGNGLNTVTTLDRSVFAASMSELGMTPSTTRKFNVEGTALPNASVLNVIESPYMQWTRTPRTDGTTNAYVIYNDGYPAPASDSCTSSRGARPVFTLPSDTLVMSA